MLTGSHKTPTPTFTTFQPVDLPRKSCQGLGLLPELRPQTLKAEEAQFSPRALDVHAAVSRSLGVQLLRFAAKPPVGEDTQGEPAGAIWGCLQGKGIERGKGDQKSPLHVLNCPLTAPLSLESSGRIPR